ncbi:MAG: cupin domain-containing protein, partial [Clostridia bacterium]|nr:cupin domain-containing protein [Clostridia bacterium]
MKLDEWNRSPNQMFLYMEWSSIRKAKREQWVGNRHSNSSYEMHLILEGEAEVEICEEKYHLQEGQGLVIPPGVFHSGTNTTKPFLRLTASFLPRSETFFHLEETAFFTFSRRLRRLSYDILEEYDHDSAPWKREMLSSMFFRLMISVFRQLR